MRRSVFILAAACALLVSWASAPPPALAAPAVASAAIDSQARVIVKYRASASMVKALSAKPAGQRVMQQAAVLAQRSGIALTDGHPIGERAQVVFATGISSAKLAARLAADPDVEYAEPDLRRHISSVPNDPLYPGNQPTATPTVGQWYLRPPTSTNVSAIDAESAWDTTTGTSSIVVAVLDTGVLFNHPDLVGKLYPGFDFISDVRTANDGDGRDGDASDPGDWVTTAEVNDSSTVFYHCTEQNPDGTYTGDPSSWHGTQVAGLIGAATDNGRGMASVGRNVMILPVRVLGKCGGYDSDIQAAMLWAGGLSSTPVVNPHPAKVINLSLGSSGACTAGYQDIVSRLAAAGVAVVASAGNAEGLAVDSPANCAGVIGVAGVRHVGTKVGFSSIGPEVAISAPAGNCITIPGPCLAPLLTTTNTGTTVPASNVYSDSFNSSLGTSFSSPLVAGTIALMLSVNPALTPAELKAKLQATARPFPTSGAVDPAAAACHAPNGTTQDECYCTTSTCGAGLLDTKAAVRSVASATAPTAPLSASTVNPALGSTMTVSANTASVAAGHTGIYQWSVSDPAILKFTTATDAPNATLQAAAQGSAVVTLAVTDDTGATTSASTLVTVGTPVTVTTIPVAPTSSGGGGGGGGALGVPWLLALIAGVVALRRARSTAR